MIVLPFDRTTIGSTSTTITTEPLPTIRNLDSAGLVPVDRLDCKEERIAVARLSSPVAVLHTFQPLSAIAPLFG